MFQNHQKNITIKLLTIAHVFLITISNILVQYPFEIAGFHTTYGAFTYPIIFILTELTTRLASAKMARGIIYRSMFPGLLISYVLAFFIETDSLMALRIALACFLAYVAGQLLDILVFKRYMTNSSWWSAPIISTTVGNIVDTSLFFFVAFYQCSNPFLAQHWKEIAMVDSCFKMGISLIAFIPMYGFVLKTVGFKRPLIKNFY